MNKRKSTSERFWSKVEKTDSCWNWIGAKSKRGYGSFRIKDKTVLAHRWAYENLVGEIPEGLVIDHKCRNHSCVNPDHLEVVTQKENCQRGIMGEEARKRNHAKTHCKHGHELSYKSDGIRYCKECHKLRERKRRKEKTYDKTTRSYK
jgi:hypothetical protein